MGQKPQSFTTGGVSHLLHLMRRGHYTFTTEDPKWRGLSDYWLLRVIRWCSICTYVRMYVRPMTAIGFISGMREIEGERKGERKGGSEGGVASSPFPLSISQLLMFHVGRSREGLGTRLRKEGGGAGKRERGGGWEGGRITTKVDKLLHLNGFFCGFP